MAQLLIAPARREGEERPASKSPDSPPSSPPDTPRRRISTNKPLPPVQDLTEEDLTVTIKSIFSTGEYERQPERQESPAEHAKVVVTSILSHSWFDIAIAIVIAFNAALIGVELSMQLEGHDVTPLKVVDSVFLAIYIIELAMRVFGLGVMACLRNNWVRCDALLVVLGVLCSWVVEPLTGDTGTGTSADALGPVMVLRTLRMLRLVRTIRLFRMFSRIHEFWILVRGFMNGLSLMLCTGVMFALVIYIFGCLGIEMITKHTLNQTDEVFRDHVHYYFGNLPTTMMTLMRFAVLDNTSEIYTPLVKKDPWLFIYFGFVTLTVSLIAFNLLSAVVFSSTIEQSVQESDAARKAQEDEWSQLLSDLKRMFLRLDQDGSGQLSREELQNIHPADLDRLSKALKLTTPMEMFTALDVDGSGEISITEFFDGALDIVLSNQNEKSIIQVKRMEKQVETMHWRLKDLFNTQHDLDLKLSKALGEIESIREGQPNFTTRVKGVDERKSWADTLAERLKNIWDDTLQQSIRLTMQQVDEVQARTEQMWMSEQRAGSKRCNTKKRVSESSQSFLTVEQAEDGTASRTSVDSGDSNRTGRSATWRTGSKRREPRQSVLSVSTGTGPITREITIPLPQEQHEDLEERHTPRPELLNGNPDMFFI